METDKSFETENKKRKGVNLFIQSDDGLIPILRIEVNANVAFNLQDALEAQSKHAPYIPDSDKSVYIKPPLGAVYVTSLAAEKFNLSEAVSLKYLDHSNVIYDPQLSWHGGIGGKDLKPSSGILALRGRLKHGLKYRAALNESPAIAKDSLAGNYNPIANIKLPISLSSYPSPVPETSANNPVRPATYNDVTFESSTINEELCDIIFDINKIRNGLEVVVLVHNPSPLHKSRMHVADREEWIYEPITFMPDKNTALAFSILTFPCKDYHDILNAPITFIGISIDPQRNIAFNAHKV